MSLWFRPCYFYAFVLVKVENWLCVFWKKLIIMLLDSDPSLEGTIQPLETGNYFLPWVFTSACSGAMQVAELYKRD